MDQILHLLIIKWSVFNEKYLGGCGHFSDACMKGLAKRFKKM